MSEIEHVASPFDSIRRKDARGEHWTGRDLMPHMDYAKWERFEDAIQRAMISAKTAGHDPDQHFSRTRESFGSRGPASGDYRLTRFGAYLVAMNGDVRKEAIAQAQTYFAVKAREAETATAGSQQLTRSDLARMVIAEEAEKLAAIGRAEVAEQRAAELEPDALAARQMADATGLSLVGQVAKRWDMTEKALREFLYAERLLIRSGDRRNDPTAYAMERDWMASKSRDVGDPPRRRGTTYITPKGELGIWRRRYERGQVQRPHPPAQQLTLVEAS